MLLSIGLHRQRGQHSVDVYYHDEHGSARN
jgi:hypothetical protein